MPEIVINPWYPQFRTTVTATIEWAPKPFVRSEHNCTIVLGQAHRAAITPEPETEAGTRVTGEDPTP